jgi:hypothetical protein
MAGLTASFVDVYSAELSDDVAAGFLVQALSFIRIILIQIRRVFNALMSKIVMINGN